MAVSLDVCSSQKCFCLPALCVQKCYDNKLTILGTLFTGALGGGAAAILFPSNVLSPVFVAPVVTGMTAFGMLLGGTLGKVADVVLSSSVFPTNKDSQKV